MVRLGFVPLKYTSDSKLPQLVAGAVWSCHQLNRILVQIETPLKALHTALCVNNALLPCEKWVANAANFDFNLSLGRPDSKHIAAGASNDRVRIVGWVNICLHW